MADIYQPDKNRRAYIVDRLRGKITKEEANYRPHDDADSVDTCFECEHYLDPGSEHSACRRVAGVIEAEDTCDLWAARAGEDSVQPKITIQIRS